MSENRKYIALFGYYKYGNFGDDLMAVIFGQKLKSLDIPFRVYNLRPEVAAEFQFERATSLDDLLTDTAGVVYGGGGAFLATNAAEFESTLASLCEKCARKDIPIYMFSVGGEGKPSRDLARPRRDLLHAASYATFRNPEDSVLLSEIGNENGAIYNDVVWRTPAHLSVARKQTGSELTIGIDNSLLQRRRYRWIIQLLVMLCRATKRRYRFLNVAQSTEEKVFQGFAPCIRYGNGMSRFIEEIAGIDLVITRRLHLGIVAMTCDIPVVQLFPHRKAEILFDRLGLGNLVFSSRRSLVPLMRFLLNEDAIRKLRPSEMILDFNDMVEDANNHLTEMARLLQTICNRPQQPSGDE